MRTVRVLVAGVLLALSCSSSSEDDGLTLKEVVRQEIGPAGGTVVGGAVTIEIPEGALADTRTIIINEADPKARQLPADTQFAGGLYVLQPEDVTFLKPVTVTVQIDESKKRADGKGALMLFRGTGANTWTPYAADETTAKVVVGKTNHFSMWAPTAAAETYCYLHQCNPFALAVPSDFPGKDTGLLTGIPPGLDCRVPNTGGDKGVICAGTGTVDVNGKMKEKGPPYVCHCVGSDVILGTWPKLPPDTAVTAMAQQCGAPACPPKPVFACDLGMVCEDRQSAVSSWECSTQREPRAICNGPSCSCTNGKTFTLPKDTKPTNDELAAAWQAGCGGSCENASSDPNDDWVCPGNHQLESPGGACVSESAGTCRDNHVYRAECDKGGAETATCKCLVDGVETKRVSVVCIEAHWGCDFPKMQGSNYATKQCPIIFQGPLTNGGATGQPGGCRAITAGTCRDGHVYSAECDGFPGQSATCKCIIDGQPTGQTVTTTCDEAPAACGFPSSK